MSVTPADDWQTTVLNKAKAAFMLYSTLTSCSNKELSKQKWKCL